MDLITTMNVDLIDYIKMVEDNTYDPNVIYFVRDARDGVTDVYYNGNRMLPKPNINLTENDNIETESKVNDVLDFFDHAQNDPLFTKFSMGRDPYFEYATEQYKEKYDTEDDD